MKQTDKCELNCKVCEIIKKQEEEHISEMNKSHSYNRSINCDGYKKGDCQTVNIEGEVENCDYIDNCETIKSHSHAVRASEERQVRSVKEETPSSVPYTPLTKRRVSIDHLGNREYQEEDVLSALNGYLEELEYQNYRDSINRLYRWFPILSDEVKKE